MGDKGEFISKLYEAFGSSDLATIQNSIADDAILHMAGTSAISGDHKGKDEILAFLGELISRSEGTFKTEVHDILANDRHVVVLSVVSARKDNQSFQEPGVEVFHVENDKIKEAWFTGMAPEEFSKFFS